MYREEWQEILGKINSLHGLNHHNIIDTIKGKLKVKHRNIYIQWRNKQFNVNYQFPLQNEHIGNECTLLHISANFGLESIVNALLEVEGVDVNALDGMYGSTPLHQAARNGNAKIVRALLKKKAEVNIADGISGATPLHLAVIGGNAKVVRGLLKKKAEINVADSISGATPLHLAAIGGNVKIVRALLKRKAEVNIADQSGATPLHLASENDRKRVVKALLKRGSDPSVRNGDGRTPRDLSRDDGVKQLLENRERRLLFNLTIVSIIFSLIAVLETAITMWCIAEGKIIAGVISMVLTVTVIVLAVKAMTYKTSQPRTQVNEMRTERRGEREGEFQEYIF